MTQQRIDTRTMTREEWLEARRKGIGGSDAAAIVGLNPWASAYELWADKMGLLPERPDSEAMRQGRDFEDYVASRFAEQEGVKVRRVNEIITSEAYPWAIANIDRRIVGRDEGLECKTTSIMNLKKFRNGEFPTQYYVQCMHYMAVTGWSAMWLAVLVLNQGFYVFRIERDEDEITALMEAEKTFWEEHILANVPPAPDGSDSVNEVQKALYSTSEPELEIDLTPKLEALQQLVETKKRIAELEKEKSRLEQTIKDELQEAGKGRAEGFKITWLQQERTSLDTKALQEALPAFDLAPYRKTTTFRTFTIKEVS